MQNDYGYLFQKKNKQVETKDETLFEAILVLVMVATLGFVLYAFYTALLM